LVFCLYFLNSSLKFFKIRISMQSFVLAIILVLIYNFLL
jgi:hypothetical protein